MTAPHTEPVGTIPELSSNDVFRLHTATYLSIVQALSQAGLISLADMADALEAHIDPNESAPWTDILRAFVAVLRRDAPNAATNNPSATPSLHVIDGGKSGLTPC